MLPRVGLLRDAGKKYYERCSVLPLLIAANVLPSSSGLVILMMVNVM
jgi:hypothetical protein